jgi:hypothetical protein
MEASRWERIAPLTGVVFSALIVVLIVSPQSPDVHDSAAKVANFYTKHHDRESLMGFLLALSGAPLLFFASTLRHALRRAGGTGQLANAAFGGAVVAAAGFAIAGGIHLALAEAGANSNTIGTTQTLNVLDNDDFLCLVLGVGVFMLANGMSIVRHGGLPRWLGWVAVVLGIALFTPVGFFGLIVSTVWVLLVSVLLTMSSSAAGRPAVPATT